MPMHDDYREFSGLLRDVVTAAEAFHGEMDGRPVAARNRSSGPPTDLPGHGIGGKAALQEFLDRFGGEMSGSIGPRYFGFVTGGATPASIAGDWLAGAIDQNVASPGDSVAVAITVQTLNWLKQLFNLPEASYDGAFTTGATGANFACLLTAREWAGEQAGYDIAQKGLAGGPPIKIYSACPHASFVKVARFSGIGEDAIIPVARIGDSEAMDPKALDEALAAAPPGEQKIVCASAGTVTTTAFDDLVSVGSICRRHGAWLHVDGAFGLFARTVPELADRTSGIELADSITVDGHKWLNVPYDSGFYFTRRIDLIERAAGGLPAYLDVEGDGLPHYINRVLEGSQRFRALPVWMTLCAYGADGVRDIVRRNVAQAAALSAFVQESPQFELLAPTTLNVVCFRGVPPEGVQDADGWNKAFLAEFNSGGTAFMTPGAYGGKSGVRAAFSNWMTGDEDLDQSIKALQTAHDAVSRKGIRAA